MRNEHYQKPTVKAVRFAPQDVLCACVVQNFNYNEQMQCGFKLAGLEYTIFAQGWTDCTHDGLLYGYCYQPGQANVFSS